MEVQAALAPADESPKQRRRRRWKRIPSTVAAALAESILSGMRYDEAAVKYGVGASTCYKIVKRAIREKMVAK